MAEQQACVDALSRLTDAEDEIKELKARAEKAEKRLMALDHERSKTNDYLQENKGHLGYVQVYNMP